MAKQSIIKAIRAKPNARGKTSHLPLECSVKDCTNDFFVSHMLTFPPKRYCEHHHYNPPQRVVSAQTKKRIKKLQSMGLLT